MLSENAHTAPLSGLKGFRLWSLFPYIGVILAFLPMMVLRDFTPANELRYLSIADEALSTGRMWAFTNHGLAYADKPPLYLWIVMACRVMLGRHAIWALSFFSLIPALVITRVMSVWTSRTVGHGGGQAPVWLTLTFGLFAGMSVFLRMDMLMTMFIVLALWQFYRNYEHEGRLTAGRRMAFAVWIFMAVFSKGPMGILIPLVSTTVFLALRRDLRGWSRHWGWQTWGVLLFLCVLWFGAVLIEGGVAYLDNLLVRQTVGRAVNSFHHKRPFWYYVMTLPYTLLPWTVLVVWSLWRLVSDRRKSMRSVVTQFCLTVFLSTLVLLSLISSKIQVYMLPAYPFVAALTGIAIGRYGWSRGAAFSVALPLGALALGGVSFLAAGCVWSIAASKWWIWTVGAVAVAGATATFYILYVSKDLSRAVSSLSVAFLAVIFIGGFALPEYNSDIGYAEMARTAMEKSVANGGVRLKTWRVSRAENLDVYLGDVPFDVCEPDTEDSAAFEPTEACVIMTRRKYQDEIVGSRQVWQVGRKYSVVFAGPVSSPASPYKKKDYYE